MSKSIDEQEELVDRSWELVKEALNNGTVTLNSPQGPAPRQMATEDIIDLAKFFVQLKVKKPQLINAPEDFRLKETSGDEDD